MFESFILRWGYLAVGIGTFLEGETFLIAGGALAHRGLLSLPLVMGSAFLGGVAGDQVWFHLGRRFGHRFLDRQARWRDRSLALETWLQRRRTLFVLGFRFVYGIRSVTPAFLGASGYSPARFLALDVLGGLAWALAVGGLGWGLGAALKAVLHRAARVEEVFAAAVLLGLGSWMLARRVRRDRSSKHDST